MFLAGSRYVSAWLNMDPQFETAQGYAEGSPIDAVVFSGLITVGVITLVRRKIDWERLLVGNGWIVLYLLYCLVSVTWTDDPATLLKRWVKELGTPIMVLIILTERRPYEAIGTVLRRLAFVTLPLSVLFIKYYPELSRAYGPSGGQMFTGVGTQKNSLGLICLLSGIYLAVEFLQKPSETGPTFIRQHKIIALILSGMTAWLLYKSNSQTSLVCLIVAVLLLLLGRLRLVAARPDRLFALLFSAILVVWLLDQLLGVKELVLALLGREVHLTTRTDIWRILLEFDVNPVIGTGFMSFWSGERLEAAWKVLGVRIHQAHNGYIEQYLNLGFIGLVFILVIMGSGLLKVRRHLSVDFTAGMLRSCLIFVAALYNYTEAAFYGPNNMWMLFLLGCIEIPQGREFRADSKYPSKPPKGVRGMRKAQAPRAADVFRLSAGQRSTRHVWQ